MDWFLLKMQHSSLLVRYGKIVDDGECIRTQRSRSGRRLIHGGSNTTAFGSSQRRNNTSTPSNNSLKLDARGCSSTGNPQSTNVFTRRLQALTTRRWVHGGSNTTPSPKYFTCVNSQWRNNTTSTRRQPMLVPKRNNNDPKQEYRYLKYSRICSIDTRWVYH